MPRGYKKSDNLTRDILLTLTKVGIFAIGMTSPYFATDLIKIYFKNKIKERARKLKELEKRKIIDFKYLPNNGIRIELTHKGKKLVRQYQLDDMKLSKPKKWDENWRIIIYDIPTSQKRASMAISKKFHDFGLYQLQRSVWVSPFDCLPELEFICAVFEIDINRCIHYIKTPEIPKEKELKKFFDLI